jgi:Poly A polymerase head domain
VAAATTNGVTKNVDDVRLQNSPRHLQQIAPEAHIAGGAVRDTILQKQLHDIDVFVSDAHVEEAAALPRSACSYVKVGEWKEYLGFSDPAMTRVAKFEKADETTPICIIGLLPEFANPEDNIARFDFGICMAAFDGKDTIRLKSSTRTQKLKPLRFTARITNRSFHTQCPALQRSQRVATGLVLRYSQRV